MLCPFGAQHRFAHAQKERVFPSCFITERGSSVSLCTAAQWRGGVWPSALKLQPLQGPGREFWLGIKRCQLCWTGRGPLMPAWGPLESKPLTCSARVPFCNTKPFAVVFPESASLTNWSHFFFQESQREAWEIHSRYKYCPDKCLLKPWALWFNAVERSWAGGCGGS